MKTRDPKIYLNEKDGSWEIECFPFESNKIQYYHGVSGFIDERDAEFALKALNSYEDCQKIIQVLSWTFIKFANDAGHPLPPTVERAIVRARELGINIGGTE